MKRREFDLVMVNIKYPGTRPLIPDIPVELGVPQPTSMEYVEDYLQYLMTDRKKENEVYTYGERLTNPKVWINGREVSFGINPVQEVIDITGRTRPGPTRPSWKSACPRISCWKTPPACG